MKSEYPMRINKYIAHKKICTRREADALIEKGRVTINGRVAILGDKVKENDSVDVRYRPIARHYYAYNKPRGIITHSAQDNEEEIADVSPLEGVFPVGRLDKDSHGLILLTDDGRLTDALLNPEYAHEKEYEVVTLANLPSTFKEKMEKGVDIGGYVTKKCDVTVLGARKFRIVLTEGKKHQIRRMCGAFGQAATDIKRVRVMNVRLGDIKAGEHRAITGDELVHLFRSLGFGDV